jgi:hypothetical protein
MKMVPPRPRSFFFLFLKRNIALWLQGMAVIGYFYHRLVGLVGYDATGFYAQTYDESVAGRLEVGEMNKNSMNYF